MSRWPYETPQERFWAKVERQTQDACWIWMRVKSRGYGRFWHKGRWEKAHRFAYELLVGPIPEGLTIDHLCRNRACVNPAHMETVDMRTNLLRGVGPSAIAAKATHCPKGHPYDLLNTYYNPSGHRRCRICHHQQQQNMSLKNSTRNPV